MCLVLLTQVFHLNQKSALYSGDASLVTFLVFLIKQFKNRDAIKNGKKLFDKFKTYLSTLELKIPVTKLKEIEVLCNCNLKLESPLVSPVLGVAAGEVFKFTGIFDPIQQIAAYEITKTASVFKSKTSLDSFHSSKVLSSLAGLNIAMIGAGASGCEFAKSAAAMKICSKGLLQIFDDDLIETSNLNRQFLFQRSDVGKPKALALAERIQEMRP